MILLAGAFELVPLLAVLVLAVVLTMPVGVAVSVAGMALHGPALAALVAAFVVGIVGFVAERTLRGAESRHVPEWVSRIHALGRSDRVRLEAVGGKARVLGHLARLGAPVPDGVVLTTDLVERIRAATAGGKAVDRVWAVLPGAARRELEAFLGGAKGKVIVRASFTDPDAKHSYAGVFPAVRDIDPANREALVAAILHVVASADDPIGREYRRRRGAGPGIARAIIVQRQIDADLHGAISSRGLGGAADSVLVDCARRRSPMRSYRYDLFDGSSTALGFEDRDGAPPWMHRLAIFAVTIEAELGGPVKIEFAIEEGQPYVFEARRLAVAERKSWVHARPLDAPGERIPHFAWELRGGASLVRRVLGQMLERAGAPGEVREDEVRFADGLAYVDAEVIRRALARLGADVLLRGGLRTTLRSIAAVRRRPVPAVPQVTEITKDAWSHLRQWHTDHLIGAARVRLELVTREWLIRTLLRLIDGAGSSVEDRRGHPALRFLLARRLRQASEESERQRVVLEQAEAELGSAVARVLARGAVAWNAMFKGDRHLYATLEEIDQWHADLGVRDTLENEWRGRGAAFEQRRHLPAVLRVQRPPLPEPLAEADAVAPPVSGRATSRTARPKLPGVGVVPGAVRGPLVLMSGQERGKGDDAIVGFVDVRSELSPEVYGARGIVLLTGGLVSTIAELAAELGVPTVLCPAARAFATEEIAIDGATGTVVVNR